MNIKTPINYFLKQSRSCQVFIAGIGSVCILVIIILVIISMIPTSLRDELWKITGFWTLSTLVISSPVAFVIWRFRDENQSKDINLKEFQKIAEWVSGMHFPDNHIEISQTTTKTTKPLKSNKLSAKKLEISIEEKTAKTTKKPANADLFSKRSGAESLQIAAIYNLLPFYRGDHGSSFEKPAVNLLKSTWAMMQQDLLQQLNELEQDKTKTPEEIAEQQAHICQELQNRANSPLGQAITRVWMACDHNGNLLIHRHPEIFAGLCLSGMDFSLAGLEIDTLREKLFAGCDEQGNSFDYSEIQLQAVNFPEKERIGFNFKSSALKKANFLHAKLPYANFLKTNLFRAKFWGAELWKAELSNAKLSNAELSRTNLLRAKLSRTDLSLANLSLANLFGTDLSGADLSRADLSLATLSEAILSNTCLASTKLQSTFLYNTFIVIQSNVYSVCTELPQTFLQQKAIVAIDEDDSEPSLITIHCRNKQTDTEIIWEKILTKSIDLPKTQALNPNWEIEIIKETT